MELNRFFFIKMKFTVTSVYQMDMGESQQPSQNYRQLNLLFVEDIYLINIKFQNMPRKYL